MAAASDRPHLVISIYDDAGNRKSITWNGLEFNSPTLGRMELPTGYRVDYIGFSTPANFHAEQVQDISKNGGGVIVYNPLVGTRVLNMRGSLRATNESTINSQIRDLQRAFSPLLLQGTQQYLHQYAGDETAMDVPTGATAVWPPRAGIPSWVRSLPLKFTRVLPAGEAGFNAPTWASLYTNGLYLMQYHVMPLELSDPIKSAVGTGFGADYQAQFLVLDGGRSFDQTATILTGNGQFPVTWGRAPMWPRIYFTMDGAGSATATVTTTGAHMNTALVLDLDALANLDKVDIDCRDQTIRLNGTLNSALKASGDFPVIADKVGGYTTFTWTNTTNMTASSNKVVARESDYF